VIVTKFYKFSADIRRTVREYTEQHHFPAASACRERAAGNAAMGMQIVNWQRARAMKNVRMSCGHETERLSTRN
jgi:hypothetical protein